MGEPMRETPNDGTGRTLCAKCGKPKGEHYGPWLRCAPKGDFFALLDPRAADVRPDESARLRKAAEYVVYCYDNDLLAPKESNAISRLRDALSARPSTGEPTP